VHQGDEEPYGLLAKEVLCVEIDIGIEGYSEPGSVLLIFFSLKLLLTQLQAGNWCYWMTLEGQEIKGWLYFSFLNARIDHRIIELPDVPVYTSAVAL
jgi:hypothetical protein